MCNCGEANDAAGERPPDYVCETTTRCPLEGKIEIVNVEVEIDAPDNRVIMNDPENRALVSATVTYRSSTAEDALDDLPKVRFTFSDPAPDNTAKLGSHRYSSKYLGKRSDAAAVYWAAHDEYSTSSPDSYNASAKVIARPLSGEHKALARVWIKPSGVGGDDFRVKATLYKPDGTTEIDSDEAAAFTVWRELTFDKIYEMKGETHVSSNATTAKISPVFNPAFVKYTSGERTEIADANSVKYIGLWKGTATPQESWTTVQARTPAETPGASEIADAAYSGTNAARLAARATARGNIINKAQAWTDRIDSAFGTARNRWVSDTGIPNDTIVAIRYYHPKYTAGGGDGQTSEWKLGGAATPAWLRVGAFAKSGGGYHYTGLDPDDIWAGWVGLSHGNGRVTIPKGRPAAAITQTIRHEAGHATKSHFKRENFGPSLDHSASNAGIMYYSSAAGGTTFATREKKILRGIKP